MPTCGSTRRHDVARHADGPGPVQRSARVRQRRLDVAGALAEASGLAGAGDRAAAQAAAARPCRWTWCPPTTAVELRDGDERGRGGATAEATGDAGPTAGSPVDARRRRGAARGGRTPATGTTRSRPASRAARTRRRRAADLPRPGRTTTGSPPPGRRTRRSPAPTAGRRAGHLGRPRLRRRLVLRPRAPADGAGPMTARVGSRRRRRARRTSWSGRLRAQRGPQDLDRQRAVRRPTARCVAQAQHLWIAVDWAVSSTSGG